MCPDCGRPKMQFESEAKADNFIRFNGDEVSKGRGMRSYHCPACCCWHITTHSFSEDYDNRTKNLIDRYHTSVNSEQTMAEKVRIKNERPPKVKYPKIKKIRL